jgi:AcrR family transcriptional regulator
MNEKPVKNGKTSQQRREQKQREICHGALQIFRKKGFHATSMREIAAASGVGLGNLYNYINKKEDILFLIHQDILAQIYNRFDRNLKNHQNPIDQIINIIREEFNLVLQIKEEMLFVYTETKSLEKEDLHKILGREAEFVAAFQALIERGVREGVFLCEKPALYANLIVFTMSIMIMRSWNILPHYSANEVLNEVMRFVLLGLGVSSERIPTFF